jgi:outer membrane immunogenic protein
VNAGYGWHDTSNGSVFVPAGTFLTAPGASGTLSYGEDNGDGFVGGGQIGYNYQIGSFVVGVEADLQWADLGGSNNGVLASSFVLPPTFVPAGVAGGIDWFGTVRARFGVAFDRALIYATGGFAYGGADDNNGFNGFNGFVNDDDVRTGWVLGAGMEYAFTNNLTAGIEGLWVSLDRGGNGAFIGTETTPAGAVLPVFVPGRDEDDNDFFVARAKLNFKFGTY